MNLQLSFLLMRPDFISFSGDEDRGEVMFLKAAMAMIRRFDPVEFRFLCCCCECLRLLKRSLD